MSEIFQHEHITINLAAFVGAVKFDNFGCHYVTVLLRGNKLDTSWPTACARDDFHLALITAYDKFTEEREKK